MRARFVLVDRDGKQWTDALDSNMGREARLRVGSGVSMAADFPELMRGFARSWAATMLGRHPTAQQVTVVVETYELPPMDAYATGDQAEWMVVYQESFDRK
jgi:hypothetical protein